MSRATSAGRFCRCADGRRERSAAAALPVSESVTLSATAITGSGECTPGTHVLVANARRLPPKDQMGRVAGLKWPVSSTIVKEHADVLVQ